MLPEKELSSCPAISGPRQLLAPAPRDTMWLGAGGGHTICRQARPSVGPGRQLRPRTACPGRVTRLPSQVGQRALEGLRPGQGLQGHGGWLLSGTLAPLTWSAPALAP